MTNLDRATTIDTDRALDLIKEGIEGLLEDIATGSDPWMEPKDLAEGKQLNDEMVFDWISRYKDMQFRLYVGESDKNVDKFVEMIISVLNSEWYEEAYQFKVAEVRDGIMQQADWERTKKSLMPKWRP